MMINLVRTLFLLVAVAFLCSGCGTFGAKSPGSESQEAETQEVLAQPPSLAVSHSIEGTSVNLTFLTRNFTFVKPGEKQSNRSGQGYVRVTVDNQTTSVYNNRFDTADLTPGAHTFSAELVQNSGRSYPNTKINFTITIKPSEPAATF